MRSVGTMLRCGSVMMKGVNRLIPHRFLNGVMKNDRKNRIFYQQVCLFSNQTKVALPTSHDSYEDEYISGILKECNTIIMVGLSPNWNKPSYFAAKYLQSKGYRVIPVNPSANTQTILGEKVYSQLGDIPIGELGDLKRVIIDIFRNSKAAAQIVKDAKDLGFEKGGSTIWMQLGVRNDEAAKTYQGRVVMNRCPKIEFARLFGEIGWSGINSGVLTSKRRPIGVANNKSSTSSKTYGFETLAVHSGCYPDHQTGARLTPIYQNTSFVFNSAQEAADLFNLSTFGNIYARLSNPTTAVLEERLATLEGGRGATCTASGHSAQLLALYMLLSNKGDKVIASNKLYGGSITQMGKSIKKFGWECNFVNTDDLSSVANACTEGDNVKALFVESIANPGGVISDLEPLAEIAHKNGIPLIVDNTLATPYLCQPIKFGADIIVHSTTKYISGNGTSLGGVIIDSGKFNYGLNPKRFPSLTQPEPAYHNLTFFETFGDLASTVWLHAVGLRDLGPTMAPMNAFLTLIGCETLPLRMQRHCENAQKIAEFLVSHKKIAWVSSASLKSSPYHELSKKYLRNGQTGAVFTIGLKGGYQAGVQLVESVNLWSHLANVGDARSLILHPASTTHRQLSDEQRKLAGATDEVVRLSVGLETAEDLINDLDIALSKIN